MKQLFVIFLFFLPFLVAGQKDTVMYFGPNGSLEYSSTPLLKKEIKKRSRRNVRISTWKLEEGNEVLLFTERIKLKKPLLHLLRIQGQMFREKIIREFKEQPDGTYLFTEWKDEKIKRTGIARSLFPLLLHGEVTEYHRNGNKKSISVYKNNELVSNENWTESGEKYIDNLFYSVEQEPMFLRGTDALHNHVQKAFKESGIDLTQREGRIVVGFVVMEDGRLQGIRIEQGMGMELNTLAVQALNSLPGEWQPARLKNNRVRYYQLFPINFIYHQYDFDNLEMKGSMLYWEIN